jgi:hypothetical protein
LQNANARRVLGHDNAAIRGMESIGSALKRMTPELVVSKQKLRQAEGSCKVRLKREDGKQNVGFSSRPSVRCGLPVRQPLAGGMLYERRNGDFVLQITGHPSYGLPFGARIASCPFTWPRLRCANGVKRFASEPPPKCWRHSECIKAARSIGGWWPPSNGSLGPPSFRNRHAQGSGQGSTVSVQLLPRGPDLVRPRS